MDMTSQCGSSAVDVQRDICPDKAIHHSPVVQISSTLTLSCLEMV